MTVNLSTPALSSPSPQLCNEINGTFPTLGEIILIGHFNPAIEKIVQSFDINKVIWLQWHNNPVRWIFYRLVVDLSFNSVQLSIDPLLTIPVRCMKSEKVIRGEFHSEHPVQLWIIFIAFSVLLFHRWIYSPIHDEFKAKCSFFLSFFTSSSASAGNWDLSRVIRNKVSVLHHVAIVEFNNDPTDSEISSRNWGGGGWWRRRRKETQ